MTTSPQDICEKFINLTKDKSRLLVGLSTIGEKERVNIDNVLKLIEQKTIRLKRNQNIKKKISFY
jgi:hypothetical protein